MVKLSGLSAPLLGIAALMLIALLLLSASYVAARLSGERVVCAARTSTKPLIKPMFNGFTGKTGVAVKPCPEGDKESPEALAGNGTKTPADAFMLVRGRPD